VCNLPHPAPPFAPGTLFLTFLSASTDLRRRILEAKEYELNKLGKNPKAMEAIARRCAEP